MGYPSDMYATDESGLNDIPNFDFQKAIEEEDKKYEGNFDKWLKILDKMILAFEYVKDDMDSFEPNYVWPERHLEPCKDGLGSILEHKFKDDKEKRDHEAYWDRYKTETEKRELIIKEGLALFAKYYRSLWD
jgi:hypothetical protein